MLTAAAAALATGALWPSSRRGGALRPPAAAATAARRCGLRRVIWFAGHGKRVIADDRDFFADQALDPDDEALFFGVAKRHGDARGCGATGAANAVNVGFRNIWHVIVDDVSDLVDIDTARRQIAGD